MPDTDTLRRLLLPALIALLLAVWLGGGVTQDGTSIDEWLQLLALPVLALASMTLMMEWPDDRIVRIGVACALAVALVPALQLLPLSAAWWGAASARQELATDLAQAGVPDMVRHWSLAPFATEQSLWSLLPALAAFLAAIALPSSQRRRLIQVIVLLALFNVMFAFFQAGLPRDSALRLYQDGGFGGLLANTNHQATACIIGMVMAVGLAAEVRSRARGSESRLHMHWWYTGLAGFFLLVLPLSTARAGLVIALPALAAVLLLTGRLRLGRSGWWSKPSTAMALGLTVLVIIGVRAALGWMAVDEVEELRHTIASSTIAIGKEHAPLGSGIGSFVQVFEQDAPLPLWMGEYVNHAHNEYVQWWLEAGWLAMLTLASTVAVLTLVGWQILRLRRQGGDTAIAGACLIAICAVLVHSWVDFPLRTTTMMATVAALAGLMLVALADARKYRESRRRSPVESEDASTTQPA